MVIVYVFGNKSMKVNASLISKSQNKKTKHIKSQSENPFVNIF